MNKKSLLITTLTVVLLTTLLISMPTLAQEEGFTETFDDPTLPGWEHSREAIVVDGVLRMNPGSYALRFGDWSDITLKIKVKYYDPGEVLVNYYFRDEAKYGVILAEGAIILEKEQYRSSTPLGHASAVDIQPDTWVHLKIVVSGNEHLIFLNDELQITATDPNPLETGAILLQVIGETTAEFDDLELTGTPFGPPPGEGELSLEGEPGGEPGGEPPPEGEPGGEPGAPPPEEHAPPVHGEAETAVGETSESAGNIIEEFFASQANDVELTTFLINLILAAITSFILSRVYIHWGSSLTNRRRFASNFMLMTITTTFIILVVRSSVALSLGLVGALSIVRFRTAVKEPEELAYLFFAIGLGIGLGDNQRLITLLALVAGIAIIGLMKLLRKSQADTNLYLTIASNNPNKVELENIMATLEKHCSNYKLMRFDENDETLEASFLVEFRKLSNLNMTRGAINALSDSVQITFLDNKGVW